MLDEIGHKMALPAVRTLAVGLRAVFRKVLQGVFVNREGVETVRHTVVLFILLTCSVVYLPLFILSSAGLCRNGQWYCFPPTAPTWTLSLSPTSCLNLTSPCHALQLAKVGGAPRKVCVATVQSGWDYFLLPLHPRLYAHECCEQFPTSQWGVLSSPDIWFRSALQSSLLTVRTSAPLQR